MNRILIVDDEEGVRRWYVEEFSEEGYEVFSTDDCSDLMDIIRQQSPDLILLDIRLGAHNGLDLLQDIRNVYYDLPVILISGFPVFKYDLKAIAADYYVVKSPDLTELKIRVKMAIEAGFQQCPEEQIRKGYSLNQVPVDYVSSHFADG